MNTNAISKQPFRIFAWSLGGLVIILLLLEGWRYVEKPTRVNMDEVIAKDLVKTADLFLQEQEHLLDQTREIANRLQTQIEQGQPQSELLKSIQEYPDIWGAGLFQGNQPIVWNNFSLDIFQEVRFSDRTESYVNVQKEANVIYWQCHVSFSIQTEAGPVPYHFYTAKRIQQTNALPFADEREFSLLDHATKNDFYTLNLSIYNPLPNENVPYRTLKTIADDSVGAVYASTNNPEETIAQWHSSNRFWRAFFALISFIIISILLYVWVDTLTTWQSLAIQLFIVGIGWLVFDYISLAEYWIPTLFEGTRAALISSYKSLCNFLVDGIFFFLAALTIQRKIRGKTYHFHSTWFLSSIFAAAFVGIINMAGITTVFRRCYELAQDTVIPLLTLQVFPGIITLVLYIALGIMLLALATVLLALNLFLFRSCRDQSKLVSAISIASFVIGLFIAQLFFLQGFGKSWVFISCLIFFGFIFGISFFLFRHPLAIRRSSPLRNTAIGALVLAIAGSSIIYNAQMSSKDQELAEIQQTYTANQDAKAEQLINNILTRLEQQFRLITEEDLESRISFIQTRFTQTIESVLNKTGTLYSFDLQLIKPNSDLVADYSTDLNSPNWVNIFDLPRLSAVMRIQQITKNTIRPIVQNPQLEDGEKYQTFYRGWIPVFGMNEAAPIAWILCSVYQERPNFNKPMRAVMTRVSYRDWTKSFAVQQYQNNRLQQVIYQGIGDRYPIYNVLQSAEVEALNQDTTIFYTSYEDENSYRNLLVRESENRTLKISTILPDYQNILFSFFRLSFTLLLVGFLFLMVYLFAKHGRVIFFGKNEQFQYRILDSFLLATLVFLIILVFATHFAIRRQNTDLVKQQLVEKLESITNATEQNPSIRNKIASGVPFSLDSLTTPLNVDASFYSDGVMKRSTTPQIYQQHLLPSALPFPVYQDLFQSQKRNALTTVMLDEQDLLIGYRSILGDDRTPVAAIAIPTFVQSPKYNQQLVETTSYLIILYLIVFGLFILGTTVISRQLTRPLHYIRQGLNKISKGDLDTTIPVTSQDEIGRLAIAYNQMVSRLKELQEELAAAEREAAWQEMAQQVAHEIKNPLTPMKLNIQHLERQLASGDYSIEELKEKIQVITQNLIVQIQSLNNIASDFSKFSKPIEEEEFVVVDMNELIDSVSNLYQHDEQITISTEYEADPATVLGVNDDLRRVVINLVKNAREALPKGGTIHIETYLRDDSLFIEIEDDGEGIAEEDKPRIFVPNFSTKSSGTGLGLAICKKVIEAHEGSISFASIKGKGTTFVIKLPVHGD